MSEQRAPATEAGRVLFDITYRGEDGSVDYLDPIPPASPEALLSAILAIEAEARCSTVISPECYPQAHRYRAVPGSRDLIRCYRCGKERES